MPSDRRDVEEIRVRAAKNEDMVPELVEPIGGVVDAVAVEPLGFGEARVDVPRSARTGGVAWLLPLLIPVAAAGAVAVVAALIVFVWSGPRASTMIGVLALLAVSVVAEALPLPIEEVQIGATSLTTIFVAGTAVLYGWAPAVLVGATAMAVVALAHRHTPDRVSYNIALYALAAVAAGLVALPLRRTGSSSVDLLAAAAATLAFYAVDVSLLAAIVARSSRGQYRSLVVRYVKLTVLPASIMASFTVVLVGLWNNSPPVAAALIGPLVAISLYQRSAHRERESTRLARTDSLTGLGNRRAFDERLQEELDSACSGGKLLALCLIDIDDFKAINDTHGHALGDLVLAEVGAQLRRSGEAFRLGGDEFALVLPGCDEDKARLVAAAVGKRVISGVYASGVTRTTSTGVAAYPRHPVAREELIRLADLALYSAKGQGKNRVAVS
jgi:diguanylate cyclase (GGDEF)-like protein